VTREVFLAVLEETLQSIRAESIGLFEKDVAPHLILELAIRIHDAKAAGRTQLRRTLLAPSLPMVKQ
jgi:hypothetical protein